MWRKEALEEMISKKLKNYNFIAVSHREPYEHSYKDNKIKWINVLSGMVTAVDPIMRACGGTWIAYGHGDADRETVDKENKIKVPPDNSQYTLKRIFLDKEEIDNYYSYGNEGLWQLMHIAYCQPVFRQTNWEYYRRVNEIYAEAILSECKREVRSFVWLQDYPLCLVARDIKKKKSDVTIGLFWHISWPPYSIFQICPQKKEILEGLLSNDLLGFHTNTHCRNFLESVERELKANIDWKNFLINYKGQKTLIRCFPISIDAHNTRQMASCLEITEKLKEVPKMIGANYEFLCLSIDRGDFIKGIPNKIRAIDRFLEKYPQYQKRFIFLQAVKPIRMHLKIYQELQNKIKELASEVNKKYGNSSWQPVIIDPSQLNYQTLLAYFRSADICLVGSLDDGMNLVAKEYLMANVDCKGMLILSQFAGASEKLNEAILINPYDIDGYANAIFEALQMTEEQKKERVIKMQRKIEGNNIYKWAGDFISTLIEV